MALKKVTKKVAPMFSAKDILEMGREYLDLSTQIKKLEERKKTLSEKIKQGSEQFGVKDDKGSYYLEDESIITGKQAKKSISINQDKAVEVLESMGLGDVIDVVSVKTVNEDRLEKALAGKRLTADTIEGFTDKKVTYSVLVKEKEEVPEVEQSTLKVAKNKK